MLFLVLVKRSTCTARYVPWGCQNICTSAGPGTSQLVSHPVCSSICHSAGFHDQQRHRTMSMFPIL